MTALEQVTGEVPVEAHVAQDVLRQTVSCNQLEYAGQRGDILVADASLGTPASAATCAIGRCRQRLTRRNS